ncbi:MAG TPA: hypothetical protein VIP48_06440, partial [Streptosporangiaceae bacterium]
ARRWPYLLLFIMLVYLGQGIIGAAVRDPEPAQSAGASLVTIFFGIGLARSWELLGPGTGGLISQIAEHTEHVLRRDRDRPPDGSPPQQ